ncbi:hypothetical protein HJG60_001688 [Phyllostomus discolor]|uniref:Dynein axonemal assembly factor 8 n=1 Tax=Phyllostomus discolor TaxID=89673 RepID=A0A834B4Q7_9CHIR|nr:hypothetical protein HJG60_001688 [Phyllostomus discolor]
MEFSPEPWGECNARTTEGRDPGQPVESSGESSSLLRMPEETPTWREGDLGGMSFNNKGSPSPSWGPQGEATPYFPEGELKMDPNAASWVQEGSDCGNRRALRRERRRMIERDLLHKVTWGARGPACSDHSQVKVTPCEAAVAGPRPEMPPQGPQEGLPVLSLQQIEELDLDHILQSLAGREDDQGDLTSGTVWWAAGCLQGRGLTLNARVQVHPQKQLLPGPLNKTGPRAGHSQLCGPLCPLCCSALAIFFFKLILRRE